MQQSHRGRRVRKSPLPPGTRDYFWVSVGVIGLTLALLQLQLYQLSWDSPLFVGQEDQQQQSRVTLQSNEVLLEDFVRNTVSYDVLASVPYAALASVLTEEQILLKMSEDTKVQSPAPDSSITGGSASIENAAISTAEFPVAAALGERLKISLHVFCWKRQKSQDRLLGSLLRADHLMHKVDLHIHIDGGYSSEVLQSARALVWPFGSKFIHSRDGGTPLGLPEVRLPFHPIPALAHSLSLPSFFFCVFAQQIMQSWNPVSDDEAAVFLEDDIEVSPYYFHYVLWCARHHHLVGHTDDRLVGYSLYTPRADETSLTENPEEVLPWRPSAVLGDETPLFLSQLPSSWGALYVGKHWKQFKRYYSARKEHLSSFPSFLNLKTNTWEKSWKRSAPLPPFQVCLGEKYLNGCLFVYG